MIRSMKRSMISTMIKSMVNPDSSAITRFLPQLDDVLMSHMVYANTLVFGASDPKTGAVCSIDRILDKAELNHRISWQGGVLAEQCGKVLRAFFKAKRVMVN